MEPKESTNMQDAAEGLMGTPKVATQTAQAPVNSPTPTSTAAPVVAASATPAPTVNPIVVKSAFGDQIYGGVPVEQVDLKTFQDVQKFAKEFIGADIKEVKDFVPLFTQVKDWQSKATQTAELQKVVDNYRASIESLPKEVVLILDTAIQNGDYKAVITNLQKKSALDYTKAFSDQDLIHLANLYTSKSYTKETFDALEESSRSALTDSVRMKFDAERTEVLNFENNHKIATDQKLKSFQTSVDASISALVASNPGMDKAAIAEIKKAMQYGLSDVLYTKDKTYAPDAAEKVAMMLYGKQTITAQRETIGDIVKKISAQSETQVTERILLRSDRPTVSTGAPSDNLIAQMVAKATDFLPQKRK
jgi:hypothetical protein